MSILEQIVFPDDNPLREVLRGLQLKIALSNGNVIPGYVVRSLQTYERACGKIAKALEIHATAVHEFREGDRLDFVGELLNYEVVHLVRDFGLEKYRTDAANLNLHGRDQRITQGFLQRFSSEGRVIVATYIGEDWPNREEISRKASISHFKSFSTILLALHKTQKASNTLLKIFFRMQELTSILQNNEKILWQGQPQKMPYIFRGLFFVFLLIFFGGFFTVPLLMFGTIFAYFLHPVMGALVSFFGGMLLLGVFITALVLPFVTHKRAAYVITTTRVLRRSGMFANQWKIVKKNLITKVDTKEGFFDKVYGNGSKSIYIRNASSPTMSLSYVLDAEKVAKLLQSSTKTRLRKQ